MPSRSSSTATGENPAAGGATLARGPLPERKPDARVPFRDLHARQVPVRLKPKLFLSRSQGESPKEFRSKPAAEDDASTSLEILSNLISEAKSRKLGASCEGNRCSPLAPTKRSGLRRTCRVIRRSTKNQATLGSGRMASRARLSTEQSEAKIDTLTSVAMGSREPSKPESARDPRLRGKKRDLSSV